MKTNSTLKMALCVAGFSAIAFIGSAQAQILVVNGQYDAGGGNYSGANASGLGGTYFNDISLPFVTNMSGDLVLASGNLENSTNTVATGITATLSDTVSANGYNAAGAYPAYGNLLGDFAYSGYVSNNPGFLGTFTLMLNNLNSGDVYNLYLYAQNGGYIGGGAAYTINGVTQDVGNTSALAVAPGSFILGNNYTEFAALTGSSSISVDIGDGGPNNTAYINGFTLVDLGPAEVPEPSTVALVGLGALGLAFLIRRHRTA